MQFLKTVSILSETAHLTLFLLQALITAYYALIYKMHVKAAEGAKGGVHQQHQAEPYSEYAGKMIVSSMKTTLWPLCVCPLQNNKASVIAGSLD